MAQYQRVHGIVIRYVNYRDNDRMLTIFTKENGRVDAKANGCRRPRSPLLPGSQTFVYGEYLVYFTKNRATVTQCEVRESFYPLREDFDKLKAASAILNLTEHVILEGEKNEELFLLLYCALSFLSYGEVQPVDMTICFLIRYFDVLGLRPHITHCSKCGQDLRTERELYFSHSTGGALCKDCGEGMRVSALALEALRRMLLLQSEQMSRVKLSVPLRKELFLLLKGYAAYQFDKDHRIIEKLEKLCFMMD